MIEVEHSNRSPIKNIEIYVIWFRASTGRSPFVAAFPRLFAESK